MESDIDRPEPKVDVADARTGESPFGTFARYDGQFMTPYLAVGSRPHPEDVADIVQSGIRGILNTASFGPKIAFDYIQHLPESVRWMICGFWDGYLGKGEPGVSEELTPAYARLVVIRAAEMLRDHGPLLVHCMGGKGRSGNVAAILYAAREKVTVDEAIERMRAIRPVLSPFRHTRFWRNVVASEMVELATHILNNPDLPPEEIRGLIRG